MVRVVGTLYSCMVVSLDGWGEERSNQRSGRRGAGRIIPSMDWIALQLDKDDWLMNMQANHLGLERIEEDDVRRKRKKEREIQIPKNGKKEEQASEWKYKEEITSAAGA